MGMRDFLNNAAKNLKQKAQDRLNPKPLTPEEEKARKQAAARKQFEQINNGVELVKKVMKVKKSVDEKTDAIKDGIAEKTIAIVGKIEGKDAPAPAEKKPSEPKKPGVIGKGVAAVKGAGASVAGKAKSIAAEQRQAAARKPSTRSGLLDLIVPAVPETKATAPKKPAAETGAKKPATKGATKTPRTRKPKQ